MQLFKVSVGVEVEAENHAEAVMIVYSALKEKNAQLVHERKTARVEVKDVAAKLERVI